jgi:hypothetical protein
VEEAAADVGWRRSSGQRPSLAHRPPAAVVGAWPGEAAGAWCRGMWGGSRPVEEAAAGAGWRRSSRQRPSSTRRLHTIVVDAWPGEAVDAWCRGEGGGEAASA